MRRTTRQPGRPRSPLSEHRSHRLRLNLTPFEWELLHRRAAAAGVEPGRFARELALYSRITLPPRHPVTLAMVGQLARLGNLLNQAMRAVHGGRLAPDLRGLVGETLETLIHFRGVLLS